MEQTLNTSAAVEINQEPEQIQEMSMAEVEDVSGGIQWVVWAAFEWLSLDRAYAVTKYYNY